ncbi:MAG TPA: hypothetical protein VGI56_12530 [Galbitalea sp.]|jgi:hypothetical protein
MSAKAPGRKSTAAILVALLAAAALTLSPAGIGAAEATATPQQQALSDLNALRFFSTPFELLFDENGFVDDSAQAAANNYAGCSGCANPTAVLLSSAPGDVAAPPTYSYVMASGGTLTARLSRIANDFYLNFQESAQGHDAYASIGIVTKGTVTYAALITVSFTGTVTDETHAGTVTLPSNVHVGVPIVPVLKGFSPAPAPASYTWVDGLATVGTGSTYTPVASDLGKRIKLFVGEHNAGYSNVSVQSNLSGVVGVGTPHAGTFAVTGSRNVGQVLTVHDVGTGWTPVNPTQQWYRNGIKIAGQTATTYTQTIADLGQHVDVKVTEAAAGYTSVTKGTATTAKTGYPLFATVPVPGPSSASNTVSIAGQAQYGYTLTALAGSWGPGAVTLKYQWRSNGAAIYHATKSTLSLSGSMVGTAISVTVTASEPGFATTSVTSKQTTDVIRASFLIASSPTVTGTFLPGHTLTAHIGTWLPTATVVAYQWYVNGTAVKGAYFSTYKVPATAVTVAVRIIGMRAYYQPIQEMSGDYGV